MTARRYPYFTGTATTSPLISRYDCDILGDLPTTSADPGDTAYVRATNLQYFFNGNSWAAISAALLPETSPENVVQVFGAVGDGVTDDHAALQAAFSSGVDLYFPQGTYYTATGLRMPDASINIYFAGGASIVIGSNVITLFTVPDGLTARRTYIFNNLTAPGGDVAGQTMMELAESNGQGIVKFYDSTMEGWNTIFNVTASDLDYIFPVDMYLCGCRLEGAAGRTDNELVKTVANAGAYLSGIVLWCDNTMLNVETTAVAGWTFNSEVDIICTGTVYILLRGSTKVDGIQGPLLCYGTSAYGMFTLEFFGGNYWARAEWIGGALSYGVATISGSIYQFDNSLQQAATLVVNGAYCKINIRYSDLSGAPPAIGIDLAFAATRTVISGNFGDYTTAAVRVASTNNRFIGCVFESSGAHDTIVETGASDNNIGVGCIGLSSGGGMTIIGAGSKFDLTLANIA